MVINEILNMKDGLKRLSKLEKIYKIEFIKSEEEFNKLPKDKLINLYTISSTFQLSKETTMDALSLTYVGLIRKHRILNYETYNRITIIELDNGVFLCGLLAISTRKGGIDE